MGWRHARRTLEIALGLMLWVWVPLGLLLIVIGTVIVWDGDPDVIPALVAVGVAAVLTPLCAITGWRLVTGRERRGGGLFNPAMVDHLEAAGTLFYAARANLWFGPDAARHESEAAAKALAKAREHWRKRAKRNHDEVRRRSTDADRT